MKLRTGMMILLLLCTVSFASGFEQYVTLKDVTSEPGLPETIAMDVERDGRTVMRLNLLQNKRLNENANVFESDLDQKNRRRKPEAARPLKGVKYYHDKRNGAALSVTCEETPSGSCKRAVEGFLNIGNETFEILPVSDTATTRNTRSSGQNIHLISRVAHFKRFHEREGNANKEYPKDYIETNQIVTRRKTSVRRQSKTEYAVEIIVVIDPYLWKRYLDRTEATDGMTKEEATEYRLRRKLAHVMNGVSLRYESIEDPDLNVYVTISEFRFFMTDDDKSPVPKGSDAPTIKDGEPYVDSMKYVNYIANWKESLPGLQHDDHIMVFTGCVLYDGDISATAVVGRAPKPGACTYLRVSILQEDRNYFTTATIAAHELGHNLNSDHDGYKDSAACEPDDRFIMAPSVTQLSAEGKYTINPWRFSPCSIASFKIYFQSEAGKCLTDHGDYYDKAEWDKHNEKLPGELHSLDKQCKLIKGDYSGVCPYGVPVTDERICRELDCVSKPGCTKHTPARGSPCGNQAERKWCIDGKCVAREIGGTTARPTTPKPSPTLPEKPDVECFETTAMLYKGHKKTTTSGMECVPWTETSYQDPSTFPDSSVAEASNYCRSPDNDTHPWCFFANESWEHCDVHKCRPADYECFPTTSNMYSGTRSVTKSGLTCGSWANTIYNHADSFPDDSIADAANYCRDPDGTGIPWCLVPDPDVVWEVCNIPKCTHK